MRVYAYDNTGAEKGPYADDPVITPIYSNTSSGGAIVYSAFLPTNARVKLHTETAKHDTTETVNIVLADAPEDSMCWRVTDLDSGLKEWNGDWTEFEAGYSLVTSAGDLVSTMTQHEGSNNLAEVYDVSLASGANLKVKIDISIGSSLSLDTTLYTLGDDTKTSACAQVTGENQYFTMKTSSTFNFFLNQYHIIYIENSATLSQSGSLYVLNGIGWTDIYVYAYYVQDEVEHATLGAWPGTRISNIENATSTVNLDYDSHGAIYKFLVAKLSGTSGTKATKVVFNDGTIGTKASAVAGTNRTGVYSFDPNLTSSPQYYVDCTGSSDTTLASTTSSAAEPILAFDIEAAIRSAQNTSVCNITKPEATSLCSRYEGLASKSTIAGSEIFTWDSIKPEYSDPKMWKISDIRNELGKIAGGDYAPKARYVVPATEQSPLTATLWIVLGCGLAGLSAIGVAYFVSKKKKRPRA